MSFLNSFPSQPLPPNSVPFLPPTLPFLPSASVFVPMPSQQGQFLPHHHHHQLQPQRCQQFPSTSSASHSNPPAGSSVVCTIREPLFSYTVSKPGSDKSLGTLLRGFVPDELGSQQQPIQPVLPADIPRAAKRKASLEVDDRQPNRDRDLKQDTFKGYRLKVTDCYAVTLIPRESIFRSEMFGEGTMVLDQLDTLIQRANKEIRHRDCVLDALYGCFTSPTVKILFALCEKLKVNLHTVFTALEIFDLDTMIARQLQDNQLSDMKRRLKAQLPLRIVTCIHIAAKLHCDSTTRVRELTISKIITLLRSIGHDYDKEAVVKSEFRVFSTLDYRLTWPQPIEIIETTLAAMELLLDVRIEAYTNCVCLLFFAYQHHNELYDALWDIKFNNKSVYKGNRRNKKMLGKYLQAARNEFRENTESDIVLRSGAIVATSFLFYTKKSDSTSQDDYSGQIATLLRIPVENIVDLSIAFLKLIHQDETTS